MEAFRRAALALSLAALFVLVLCISPATAKRGSTMARQLYSAAAWVRGRPAWRRVCLRLTEHSQGHVLGKRTSCVRGGRHWAHLRVRYRVRRSGSELGVALFRRRGSFEVARVSIRSFSRR